MSRRLRIPQWHIILAVTLGCDPSTSISLHQRTKAIVKCGLLCIIQRVLKRKNQQEYYAFLVYTSMDWITKKLNKNIFRSLTCPNKPGNKYFVAWRPRAGGSLGTRLVKARILPSFCENSAKWRAFFSPRFYRLGKAVKILRNPGNG